MAKTRTNEEFRNRLHRFAKDNVDCSKEARKAAEHAYEKALFHIQKVIAARYPKEEMEILGKYKCLRSISHARVVSENGRVSQFNFRNWDEPKIPYGHSCRYDTFTVSQHVMGLVDDAELKKTQANREKENVLAKYVALINGSKYAEEVAEVWPASKEFVEKFLATKSRGLPTVISEETIMFIRGHNAGGKPQKGKESK